MQITKKMRLPLPFIGHLFILLGFVGLGLFVAALALGAPSAPMLGAGMVVAYGAGVACFLLRKWRIGHADPLADFVLGFDPIRRWTMRWKPALNAFAITFGDRFSAVETYWWKPPETPLAR